MKEALKDLIVNVFGDNVWLAIIIMAMVPVLELRYALPYSLNRAVWGTRTLKWWQGYLCAVIGSTIPALIIIPLLLPFFGWLKKTKVFRKLAEFLDDHFSAKSKNLEQKVLSAEELSKKERTKFWGVVLFVAVPLPLTGAWTGSAVAAYLKMNTFKGVLAVMLGNMISGAIMLLLSLAFGDHINYILDGFLVLAVVVIVASLIYAFIKAKKAKKASIQMDAQDTSVEK